MTQSLNILLEVWLTRVLQVTFVFMPECSGRIKSSIFYTLWLTITCNSLLHQCIKRCPWENIWLLEGSESSDGLVVHCIMTKPMFKYSFLQYTTFLAYINIIRFQMISHTFAIMIVRKIWHKYFCLLNKFVKIILENHNANNQQFSVALKYTTGTVCAASSFQLC